MEVEVQVGVCSMSLICLSSDGRSFKPGYCDFASCSQFGAFCTLLLNRHMHSPE